MILNRRILSSLVLLGLLTASAGPALAVDHPEFLAVGGQERQVEASGMDVRVNGVSIAGQASLQVVEETTYISLRAMTEALYPDAQVTWSGGTVSVTAQGLTLTAKTGERYLAANGRYLYVPEGIRVQNGVTLVPLTVLAKALGATVTRDTVTGALLIASGSGPIQSGETYYDSDAVYWLSHIINAESGNQPLEGKIAVGTVILNRVASPAYPNTIYGVIFQKNQFSPASSGSIYRQPNSESVIAAKLCLDGAREAEGCLYFNAVGLNCWASRNRTLVTTIGNHSFYQ